jgi:hypothetical protein
MCTTGAATHLREKFPHFCTGSVGKKVLLKAPPVAKEEIRSPLVNDVSREQVERAIDGEGARSTDTLPRDTSAGGCRK